MQQHSPIVAVGKNHAEAPAAAAIFYVGAAAVVAIAVAVIVVASTAVAVIAPAVVVRAK